MMTISPTPLASLLMERLAFPKVVEVCSSAVLPVVLAMMIANDVARMFLSN
jgi:hypothetical protein